MMQGLLHENLYLDTNIIIAAIEAFNQKALSLFNWAEKGKVFLITSEIAWGEVLVKPMQNQDETLIARYQTFFDSQNVEVIAPDREIMHKAAELSARLGLELPDAIHLATAELTSCAYIISEDKDLRHYSPVDCLSLCEITLNEEEAV